MANNVFSAIVLGTPWPLVHSSSGGLVSRVSKATMRGYLGRSIASFNANKLNGLLAEVALRDHIAGLGFADRISPGGWIARSKGPGVFAEHTAVLFPETVTSDTDFRPDRTPPNPTPGLLTVSSSFQQAGIAPYFCAVASVEGDSADTLRWSARRMGVAQVGPVQDFPSCLAGFQARTRRYNFLRHRTDTSSIPENSVEEEFSKEHLRVTLQSALLAELSDVDGVFYGSQFAYPLEIKEKTVATDRGMGEYFGLDLGPFVKLAFYGSKRGQLHSLFVVREIDSPSTRNELAWWLIRFEDLAQCASWIPRGGGTSMGGGASTVVMVPRRNFKQLDAATLAGL